MYGFYFQGELDELQTNAKILDKDLKNLQIFKDEQQEIFDDEKKKKVNFCLMKCSYFYDIGFIADFLLILR